MSFQSHEVTKPHPLILTVIVKRITDRQVTLIPVSERKSLMKELLLWIRPLAVCLLLSLPVFSQDRAPDQPFQTVHLTTSDEPGAEKGLIDTIRELNEVITRSGCPKCIYHLYKAYGEPSGV